MITRVAALIGLLVPLVAAQTSSWVKDAGSRVTNGSVPYIYKLDDGSFRLLYCGQGGILSARSSDGLSFTQEAGVRLAGVGGPGAPESTVCDPSVVRLPDGRHRLYYKGATGGGGPGQSIHRVYSAISTDGLSYTREGLRLESEGTIDGGWASVPEVIRTFDGRFRMYYVASNGPSRNGIASAISADGLNFTREDGMRMVNWVDPAIIRLPSGQYWMLGLAGLPQPGAPSPIRAAHSADGLNFVVDAEVLVTASGGIETGIFDPTVIALGQGRYRVYYGALGPGSNATNSSTGPEPVNTAFAAAVLTSAADGGLTDVAPDSLATLWAPRDLAADGGTAVLLNGRAVQVLYASATQVNIVVPAGLVADEIEPQAQAIVTAGGRTTTAVARLTAVAPGLFQSTLDARTFVPGPFRVAPGGTYIALFGSGLRRASRVTATLGGREVTVLYFGAQASFAGLDQVNVFIPADFPLRGVLEAVIEADGRKSNGVRVTLE